MVFAPIKILEVELASPATALEPLDGQSAVRCLARLYGAPLGYVDFAPSEGPLAAAEVRARLVAELGAAIVRQHLIAQLAGPAPASLAPGERPAAPPPPFEGPWPTLTVAVCTRDRPEQLARCLTALCALDYPHLELLVVDNAPSDDAAERLVRGAFPQARYVREERPGLDWARSRAVRESGAEIVAFADDDVVVDRGWARALARVFAEEPGVMGVIGLVAPLELTTAPQVLFERYGGFGRGFRRRWYGANIAGGERAATEHVNTGQYGTGANMAYRRAVFARIGLFDPALDVGTVTNGGGDLEMFFRVIKAGFPLVYEPRALVRHRHRPDYASLRRQIANNGVGCYAYLVRSFLHFPEERLPVARFALWWFLYWSLRRLALSFVADQGVPRDLVWAELWGSLAGLGRYQRARRLARPLARPDDQGDQIRAPGQRPAAAHPRGVALRTVDLAHPLCPLDDVTGYPAVRVYLAYAGRLVGEVELANYYQPVSVGRLAEAIADTLQAELLTATARPTEGAPTIAITRGLAPEQPAPLPAGQPVSVVVATCDRPEHLRRCLEGLAAQRTNRPVEIVVVDNRPASGVTHPVVAAFPGVRLVSEPRQGVAYARNAGILVATGAIVAIIDDDVVAPPTWLEELVAPFAAPEVAAVAGLILPADLDGPEARIFEQYGGLGRGYTRFTADAAWFASFRGEAVPTWQLGGTANLACRAGLFRDPAVGLLDEALGPGMPSGIGEDTYLFYRLLRAGHAIRYEPRAWVRHHHRQSRAALRSQIYNYSKGHVAYHLTTLLRDGDRRALRRLVRLPYYHLRALLAELRRGLRGRSAYPLELTLVELRGNLAGPLALLRSLARVRRQGRSAAPLRAAGEGGGEALPAPQVSNLPGSSAEAAITLPPTSPEDMRESI